jgi:hypothetical protein
VLPGAYDLRFSAPGFESEEVGGIAVIDGPATVVDVTLHRGPPRRSGGRLP